MSTITPTQSALSSPSTSAAPAAYDPTIHTLDVVREVRIDAPIEVVFEAVLAELGPEGLTEAGKSMLMKLEPWPGGRWFRDLGEGVGHLWGHVQVIKPPKLIELTGPLFMSFPAVNHLQYRLVPDGAGTLLTLTHHAFGQIPKEHRDGLSQGWDECLQHVANIATRLHRERARV